MDIKTKAYSLPKNVHLKECYKDILLSQWWLILIINSLLGYCIYIKLFWAIITIPIIETLYLLFWLFNLIGIRYIPQANLIFAKVFYIFSDDCIKICLSENNMAIINWDQIKKIKVRKDYLVLFLARAHIIYIPKTAFKSNLEKNMLINTIKFKLNKTIKNF